jgi:hypothetical protein
MARRRYVEEITVYDITAASGYKTGLTGDWDSGSSSNVVTDTVCEMHFKENQYESLPDKTGTATLTAKDLSSVFNYKSYADADAAKSAVLNDAYVSWISDNTVSANYTWNSGKLKIDMMFADQSAYDTFLAGVKDNNKRTFKFTGPVVSTVAN